MDYSPGPIAPLGDEARFHANTAVDLNSALVGQLATDLGSPDTIGRDAAAAIAGASAGDPTDVLTAHEAALIASQEADRATFGGLYLTDVGAATDALSPVVDGGLQASGDVGDAHGALSPVIDTRAAEIPPIPPDLPDDPPDDENTWRRVKHPPED